MGKGATGSGASAQGPAISVLTCMLDQLRATDSEESRAKLRAALQEETVSRARVDEVIQLSGRVFGLTPFFVAFMQNDYSLMSLMAGLGADVNEVGPEGVPAFVSAVRAGDETACRLLLSLGADPQRAAADGTTVMHAAAQSGHAHLLASVLGAHAESNRALIQRSREVFNAAPAVEETPAAQAPAPVRDGAVLSEEFLQLICVHLKQSKLRATDLVAGSNTSGGFLTAAGLNQILDTVGLQLTAPEKNKLARAMSGALPGSRISVPTLLESVRVQRRSSGSTVSRTPAKTNTLAVRAAGRAAGSAKKGKPRAVTPPRSQLAQGQSPQRSAKSPARAKNGYKALPRQPDTTRKQRSDATTTSPARNPPDDGSKPAARPTTPPRRQINWFYASDSLTTIRVGPVPQAAILELVKQGQLQPEISLVWRSGMKVWSTIKSCPDFAVAAPKAPLGTATPNTAKRPQAQPAATRTPQPTPQPTPSVPQGQPRMELAAKSTPPQRSRSRDRGGKNAAGAKPQKVSSALAPEPELEQLLPQRSVALEPEPEPELEPELPSWVPVARALELKPGQLPMEVAEETGTNGDGVPSRVGSVLAHKTASEGAAPLAPPAKLPAAAVVEVPGPDRLPKSEMKRKTRRKEGLPQEAKKPQAMGAQPAVSITAGRSLQEMLSSMETEMLAVHEETEAAVSAKKEPEPIPGDQVAVEPEPEPAAAAAVTVLLLSVPAGKSPGKTMQVPLPGGHVVAFEIPDGMQPDDQFEAELPSEVAVLIDTNQDGVITEEELKVWTAKLAGGGTAPAPEPAPPAMLIPQCTSADVEGSGWTTRWSDTYKGDGIVLSGHHDVAIMGARGSATSVWSDDT